jgi:hypothetical protein
MQGIQIQIRVSSLTTLTISLTTYEFLVRIQDGAHFQYGEQEFFLLHQ